ncbi:DNA sulfur modification protein DndD, ATPase [Halanaeroarchaeum sp. HSR-CO]|uniref:archaea-specific SMC-related protein n=1 Tax=Halanaeroarchaeum sp. HSR-CO TaxID=2866382 RepID=UPI00217E71A0|nr:archaea-specific SMC-related protein [Halanaeroarchaeum sp. HSR-CO]UWG47991.1 DNA sulfur modification protein DndD, ATPase [Halanaeroarchaeum sp. HSR-CO]
MNPVSGDVGTVEVQVENVGGIDETTATIPPGVTVLVGRNATNRTSFLKAMMAVLGSDEVPLKAGKSAGRIECVIGDTEYVRTATRKNGTVLTEGTPYLDAADEAESFAFLLESNNARRAVERGEDLRNVVLDPLDIDGLREEIRDLERERAGIDEQLEERSSLESRERELQAELERIDEELSTARDRQETLHSTIEETDEGTLAERYRAVAERHAELEEIRYDRTTVEESCSALRDERQKKRSKLEALEPVPDASALRDEIAEKRAERNRLDSQMSELQRVVQFNRRRLDANGALTEEAVATEGEPTEQLFEEQTSCWTCGSTVPTEQIRSTVEQLQSYRRDLLDRRETIDEELTDLQRQRDELDETRDRVRALRNRLDEIASEVSRREERLQSLERRETELEAQIADAEEADGHPASEDSILEAHGEASRLEATIDHLEDEREEIVAKLDSVTTELDELSDLESRRERITTTLTDKRDEVDRLERRTIEEFNETMAEILDELGYDNVERIWLERRKHTENGELVPDTSFDLHVIRAAEDGTVYEDTVDHLSESEREITGLVFALAGYLAHEVFESMPFLVLDSIEAIDGERIGTLVDYVSEHATYLLVALLPDDAQYVDADHEIAEI